MKKINGFKVGSDPELFLTKNGSIISAEGIIGGTKDEPKEVTEHGHAIQEDNVMIEFNIPPCETADSFLGEINYMKEYLNTYVKLKDKTYGLSFTVTHDFTDEEVNTEQAKVFGCDPDFNVYTKFINDPPSPAQNKRSCGGHIHIGYDNPEQETTEQIIYALDIMLGLDSVLLDNDRYRKLMYGKAGSFRFKPYGLEYRTLSNFWIADDMLIKWVFNRVESAINLVNSGHLAEILEKYESKIKDAIDNSDVKLSIEVYSEIQKILEDKKIKIVS